MEVEGTLEVEGRGRKKRERGRWRCKEHEEVKKDLRSPYQDPVLEK